MRAIAHRSLKNLWVVNKKFGSFLSQKALCILSNKVFLSLHIRMLHQNAVAEGGRGEGEFYLYLFARFIFLRTLKKYKNYMISATRKERAHNFLSTPTLIFHNSSSNNPQASRLHKVNWANGFLAIHSLNNRNWI